MPVEFVHDAKDPKDAYKLLMAYDGSGCRISKTRLMKSAADSDWLVYHITHYTGIGTEVRENYNGGSTPETKVVMNLPEGLGRYMPEDAEKAAGTAIPLDKDGKPVFMGEATPEFEWYLKNHLGSTMLVYGTQPYNDKYSSYAGGVKAAYDYRAFGEQVSLAEPTDKVTENFTGKEKDDETQLNYFGARYLDPMLGLWTSVDAARQYDSPYTYVGNNPIILTDPDGNVGVVGGLIGVGVGFGQALAISKATNENIQYSFTDALVDFAFGAAGLTLLNQGKKVLKATNAAVKLEKSAKSVNRIRKSAELRECAKEETVKAGIAGGGLLAATLGKKEIKNTFDDLDAPTSNDVSENPADLDINTEQDLFTSGNVSVGDILIE